MESKQEPASAHWEGVMPGKPCGVRGRASRQQLVTDWDKEEKLESGGGCDAAIGKRSNRIIAFPKYTARGATNLAFFAEVPLARATVTEFRHASATHVKKAWPPSTTCLRSSSLPTASTA